MNDACSVGYCDTELGCVRQRKTLAGLGCASPLKLDLNNGAGHGRADTTCGAPRAELVTRGAPGNAAWFEIDLTEFKQPVTADLLVGAAFPVDSVLLKGQCEDSFVVEYAHAENWAGEPGAVRLTKELEPAVYRLIVASLAPDQLGPIELAARITEASKSLDPFDLGLAKSCQELIELRSEPGVQVRLDLITEVTPIAACAQKYYRSAPCYSLDLRDREVASLVQAEVRGGSAAWTPFESAGTCEGDGFFSALLAPARYKLWLSTNHSNEPVALRLTIVDRSCEPYPNDACERAIPILLNDEHRAEITGDASCGTLRVQSIWGSQEPQLFYRLDLSEWAGPVRLRIREKSGSGAKVLVLESSQDSSCSESLHQCEDCVVAPRAYLLAVQGSTVYDFELSASSVPPPSAATCIPNSVMSCAWHSVRECQQYRLNHPRCVAVLESCGLDWPPLKELCQSHPECCDEALATPNAPNFCQDLFIAAGAACPDCLDSGCWLY
ncbi:MAG TPA: hypothetical protein VFQ61_12975 [Polyangiaceae bacterium]|nr:hypothetical protein [Polyangiaceae bacterium]